MLPMTGRIGKPESVGVIVGDGVRNGVMEEDGVDDCVEVTACDADPLGDPDKLDVPVAVGDRDALGVPDLVVEVVWLVVGAALGVAVTVAVPEPVWLRDCVWLGVGDVLAVCETVGEPDADCVLDGVAPCEALPDGLGVWAPVAVIVVEGVDVAVVDALSVTLEVCEPEVVRVADGVGACDGDAVSVADCVVDAVSVTLGVCVSVGEPESVDDGVGVPACVVEGDADGDGVAAPLPDSVCEGDTVVDPLIDPVECCDPDAVALGVCRPLGVSVADGVLVCVRDGLADIDPVRVLEAVATCDGDVDTEPDTDCVDDVVALAVGVALRVVDRDGLDEGLPRWLGV